MSAEARRGAAFRLEGIDHVALAVRDVADSARWYREVLGIERRDAEVWGDFPPNERGVGHAGTGGAPERGCV